MIMAILDRCSQALAFTGSTESSIKITKERGTDRQGA